MDLSEQRRARVAATENARALAAILPFGKLRGAVLDRCGDVKLSTRHPAPNDVVHPSMLSRRLARQTQGDTGRGHIKQGSIEIVEAHHQRGGVPEEAAQLLNHLKANSND